MTNNTALSDGALHARITTRLIIPSALVGALIPLPLPLVGRIIFSALGCAFGLFCGPDLDQESVITENEWAVLRIPVIGWLLGSVWIAVWIPYALVARHRGSSHCPFVGTAIRLLYLGAVIWIISFFSRGLISLPVGWWIVYFYAGLCIADIGHWSRDMFGVTL